MVLKVVQARARETLHRFISAVAADATFAYLTDEWAPYEGIADHDIRHESVNHLAEEWVRYDVHAKSVENIWCLHKRSIVGANHHVSVKHLDAYARRFGVAVQQPREPLVVQGHAVTATESRTGGVQGIGGLATEVAANLLALLKSNHTVEFADSRQLIQPYPELQTSLFSNDESQCFYVGHRSDLSAPV